MRRRKLGVEVLEGAARVRHHRYVPTDVPQTGHRGDHARSDSAEHEDVRVRGPDLLQLHRDVGGRGLEDLVGHDVEARRGELLLHSLLDDLGDTAVVDERRYLLDVVDRAELDELLRPRGHGGDILRLRRSEEHTSELQSLMRNSYAVFCLKKKTN